VILKDSSEVGTGFNPFRAEWKKIEREKRGKIAGSVSQTSSRFVRVRQSANFLGLRLPDYIFDKAVSIPLHLVKSEA
jgi:hypothetical protein